MTYHLVFDKFPSPEGSRFIELEDSTGHSISAGEWRERKDGYVELVLPAPAGWQDIATAPRDTPVWVAHPCGYMSPAHHAHGYWHGFYENLPIQWKPRLWQPLPSPPMPLSYEGEQS